MMSYENNEPNDEDVLAKEKDNNTNNQNNNQKFGFLSPLGIYYYTLFELPPICANCYCSLLSLTQERQYREFASYNSSILQKNEAIKENFSVSKNSKK